MNFLRLTLSTGPENLALDEALLDDAEAGPPVEGETLRVWESPQPMAVIGRSSRAAEEVDLEACASLDIPVLRRSSGGAAVVAGPGCLMYAVVLSYARRPALKFIDYTHRFVLEQIASAVRQQIPEVRLAGISDLAWRDRKISGNSVRCKRSHLLYHGTLLYNFPLDLLETCLRTPPRQPDYRRQREHIDFVTNIPLDVDLFVQSLVNQWQATPSTNWPRERVKKLVAETYGRDEWNMRR
jgi:lipoate-protein ligase A